MENNEFEMYEGLPLFEASDKRELKKKLAALENPPAPPYAVRVTNNKNKEMKEDAFCKCKEIGVAIIAEPYKIVEWGAFAACINLTKVVFESPVGFIRGCAFIKRLTGFTGCTGLKELVVPDTVESIGKYAFYKCKGLKAITIPESVTEIGDYAFEGCKKLKSVVIPDSVKKIGYHAFVDCVNLTDITLSQSLKTVSGFFGCKALTNIVIPKAVKTIDPYAFANCAALESVTFCGSVKEIDETAFKDCTGIGFKPNKSLKVIIVPAKKGDYYKSLLPEALRKFVVELPAEKKAKK